MLYMKTKISTIRLTCYIGTAATDDGLERHRAEGGQMKSVLVIALAALVIIVGLALIAAGLRLTFKAKGGEGGMRTALITVQGPTGILVIVLGLICLGGGAYLGLKVANPSSAKTANHPSAFLQLPTNGTKVSRSLGFVARGRATNLGKDSIWVLDYSGGYIVDSEAELINGQWSAIDQPLGNSSDHLPYSLTMVAVFADRACAARLDEVNATNNDFLNSLPTGCKPFAQVTVNVTLP